MEKLTENSIFLELKYKLIHILKMSTSSYERKTKQINYSNFYYLHITVL